MDSVPGVAGSGADSLRAECERWRMSYSLQLACADSPSPDITRTGCCVSLQEREGERWGVSRYPQQSIRAVYNLQGDCRCVTCTESSNENPVG